MTKYQYDEGGNMAAYFLLTFLALVLVPMTITAVRPSKKLSDGCSCQPCIQQRKNIRSLSRRKISKRTYFLIAGWSLVAFITYKAANATIDNKVYNPFEILGLSTGISEKEIKSHYKKLSKKFHPDKVKATANMTLEMIQNQFVDLTKAYKALTDPVIRENLEKYGHPDGRQDISMGIALPSWFVESKNNIWVLGAYGILFGGALPALVGRWWFGNRQKTKDGVNARSAAAFFKGLKEEADFDEVLTTFSQAYKWEASQNIASELMELEKSISEQLGSKWAEIKKSYGTDQAQRNGLVLTYAHLLRIPVMSKSLQKEQADLLLQTPQLLNSLLNISLSRNWLAPSLAIMRLHTYLTQALLPSSERIRFAQLPNIKQEEISTIAPEAQDVGDIVHALEQNNDSRVSDVKTAVKKWGRVEIVDAAFKVIGERVVTPSSIVFLVVKLRLSPPPLAPVNELELSVDETKRRIKMNEEKDEEFLSSRKDFEDLAPGQEVTGLAHAPYWPGERKPTWWIVLGDEKSNRVVVPPMRISEIPYSQSGLERDYRSYKIQFQAPQSVGIFTWKVMVISDTFMGEDVSKDITLKLEDPATLANEDPTEDEISDPEEDSLAGQMAMMRGGSVKKGGAKEDDESDDESSTDDDEASDDSSDSDSD